MTIEAGLLGHDHTTFDGVSGGTDKAISIADPNAGPGKIMATFDAQTDFLTRKSIDFAVKNPVANAGAPGGYTQATETVLLRVPIVLSNGNRTVNTIQLRVGRDPEWSVADFLSARLMACQLLADSAFETFWVNHRLQ